MTGEETSGFEGDIVSEETNPKVEVKKPEEKPQPKPRLNFSFKKPNISLSNIKKPKMVTVISLFFAIVALFAIFVVLQSKLETTEPEVVSIPQNPQKKPQESKTPELPSKIDRFYKEIDSASTNINPPQLDLNLNY